MHGFVAGYYKGCVLITRLAYVNFLWVLFTMLGLGVFGLMPATAAMFGVVRKWEMKEEINTFSTFLRIYKEEFVKTNLFGIVLFVIGYLLVMEFQILRSQESTIYLIVSFGVLAVFLMYLIILTYFFPVFVHFNLKFIDYMKWPFVIGVVHPLLSIFLFVVIGCGIYMTFVTIPALLFFFGGSVTAYIIMWGAAKTFPKYEMKEVSS